MLTTVLKQLPQNINDPVTVNESVIDESDGVRALFLEAEDPKEDACAVLLPSADTLPPLQNLDQQVGSKRNMIVVNPQWRRDSDFGSFFGGFAGSGVASKTDFVKKFSPTFSCTSLMVEGDQVRILRAHPGPWRVFVMQVVDGDYSEINWVEVGSKDFLLDQPKNWKGNNGALFDFALPSYREIEQMIKEQDGFVERSPLEKAAASVRFIKDTL